MRDSAGTFGSAAEAEESLPSRQGRSMVVASLQAPTSIWMVMSRIVAQRVTFQIEGSDDAGGSAVHAVRVCVCGWVRACLLLVLHHVHSSYLSTVPLLKAPGPARRRRGRVTVSLGMLSRSTFCKTASDWETIGPRLGTGETWGPKGRRDNRFAQLRIFLLVSIKTCENQGSLLTRGASQGCLEIPKPCLSRAWLRVRFFWREVDRRGSSQVMVCATDAQDATLVTSLQGTDPEWAKPSSFSRARRTKPRVSLQLSAKAQFSATSLLRTCR